MADYRAEARRAARRYGLDPGVFERQIQQESGFNPNAHSPAGAQGIAQIMPATARGWGVDPSDPIASLNAAAKNMASYVKKYGGYKNALVAYNAGPGRVGKPLYAETANYVKTILGGREPSATSVSQRGDTGATGSPTTTTQVIATALQGQQQPQASVPELPQNLTPQGYRPLETNWKPDAATSDLQQKIASLQKTTTTTPSESGPGRVGSAGDSPVHGSEIKELIFNDGGKGYGIKDGKLVDGATVFSAVWGGHANHVHVAAGPKTVVELGRAAQKMGLHVGENPHFGGVNSGVHVADSYHNRGQAIDVSSSDKAKMAAFARYVKRYQTSR